MAQYLKAKDFYNEIIESKKQDKLTKKAEDMLILLANRVIKKKHYFDSNLRDDCLQTGLLIMFTNWRNFDPEKSNNAFAYFTEVFKRALAKEYNSQFKLKGDKYGTFKTISIDSSNDGDGVYNL